MKNYEKNIAEDLMLEVGLGATYSVGSDSYPYYVSELLPKGVIGLYKPASHFPEGKDWTYGSMDVDPFDSNHPTETYIRRCYGHWWTCNKDGKKISRWHRISFGHAYSYQDPSF